jgi:hypothetical protein
MSIGSLDSERTRVLSRCILSPGRTEDVRTVPVDDGDSSEIS